MPARDRTTWRGVAARAWGAVATIAGCLSLCSCAAATSTGVRHISNSELRIEKSGRVVDADTGAGIPGVKIIVDWNTLSSGIPGYSSTGGDWCDLQKVVTSDENGDYRIPDVSGELDLADRGTRVGVTPFGVASQTHDKDYRLTVFKPGYISDSDRRLAVEEITLLKQNLIGSLRVAKVPDVSISSGKVTIKPIALRRVDLPWSELLAYYAVLPLGCSDRMAQSLAQPEATEIAARFLADVGPMPCSMAPDTQVAAEDFAAYVALTLSGKDKLDFIAKVKELQGAKPAPFYDPTEKIATTAGTLCAAFRVQGRR